MSCFIGNYHEVNQKTLYIWFIGDAHLVIQNAFHTQFYWRCPSIVIQKKLTGPV